MFFSEKHMYFSFLSFHQKKFYFSAHTCVMFRTIASQISIQYKFQHCTNSGMQSHAASMYKKRISKILPCEGYCNAITLRKVFITALTVHTLTGCSNSNRTDHIL